ncbi:MAG: Tm-1-like ATP-binding domain-containing protein [Gemmatales bacterium]|nr:Tm-1-like ATP-binding domain-containing protein [Gemmatales bacterium]MCS7161140.1 Tm-1-like ATP-binding domain-containing protein [Gemmatales bacterium]MDW8176343.1 Tm-1-like ATP-binding domain-containing protein [Gemmatales bacterium]MDW8222485.1 Tm-1-like ATP-binding domain-containing protein [Gemmatales bacterium]
MAIVLVGTLDTKGNEYRFLRDLLQQQGAETVVIDTGVLAPPAFPPDIRREAVFEAAGTNYQAVVQTADRGNAVTLAARGAALIVSELYRQGKVDGVLALGGSAGTTIATSAMRALPVGVPKLMVSTLASGQVRPFVGVRDICMMYSVVDISGINRISRQVLTNAAFAILGMVRGGQSQRLDTKEKPLVTATMFGVTTPCVETARRLIEQADYEVLVFHATGVGGQTMESFIADGIVAGVLDITTTELADELVGGILSAGPDRLTAAGLYGVPQVISVGALDMVNFGPPDTVPARFAGRRFYQHNPNVTLMRTTPEENEKLGKEIAFKASAAKGPTAVILPMRGVSAIDAEGKPFWWPEADHALFESIRHWLAPHVELIELDLHINDPSFAETCARKLLELMARQPARVSPD